MLSWKVGDIRITRVVEQEAAVDPRMLLPDATAAELSRTAWLKPHFVDPEGRLRLSVHSLVVETSTQRILIDTCIGNDKPRSIPSCNMLDTGFLATLEEAGFPRQSIDTVLCTHLHLDHVGWNTMLADGRWVPTFPNARYLIGRTEFEFWQGQQELPDERVIFSDSVQPVWDAGLVDLVETEDRLCREVSLLSTPGHTPGHVSVRIESGGEAAFVTGDMLHHPSQLAYLDWSCYLDTDARQAARTRREVFPTLAGTETLVIGTHFATPTAGFIRRAGDAFRFDLEDSPRL